MLHNIIAALSGAFIASSFWAYWAWSGGVREFREGLREGFLGKLPQSVRTRAMQAGIVESAVAIRSMGESASASEKERVYRIFVDRTDSLIREKGSQ